MRPGEESKQMTAVLSGGVITKGEEDCSPHSSKFTSLGAFFIYSKHLKSSCSQGRRDTC